MVLSWEKVEELWKLLQVHKSLFSDLTRGDLKNFINMLMDQTSVWFEVWRYSDPNIFEPGGPSSDVNMLVPQESLAGLIWLMGVESVVDAEVHMAFFDRKPREKKPIILSLMKWVFAHYPLHRVTASVPAYFFAHHRFVKDLGLVHEGTKRQGVLSAGVWHDVFVYGLLRSEVEAMP